MSFRLSFGSSGWALKILSTSRIVSLTFGDTTMTGEIILANDTESNSEKENYKKLKYISQEKLGTQLATRLAAKIGR